MDDRPVIALDATAVGARITGAARVLSSLLEWLPRVDPAHRYVGLVSRDGAALLSERSSAELEIVEAGRGLAWELGGGQRAAARVQARLLFTVREIVGFGPVPMAMHVFEPPAYRLSGPAAAGVRARKSRLKDRVLHATFGGSLRRAAVVTAGSRATADWIGAHHGFEPEVVLPGLDDVFRTRSDGTRSEGRFFLSPASGDPRECTPLLLEAFALARLTGIRLKVFGTPARECVRLRRLAQGFGIEGAVEFLGWVPDDELRALYSGALALVQLTRHESYGGYPALEAMALGTPVIALASPGVVEALSDAAVLIDSPEADLLAEAMRRLECDAALRASLGPAGRARVAGLTWESSARGLAAAFAAGLTDPGSPAG